MINFTKPVTQSQTEGKCQGFKDLPTYCKDLLMPNGEIIQNKTWTYGCLSGYFQRDNICIAGIDYESLKPAPTPIPEREYTNEEILESLKWLDESVVEEESESIEEPAVGEYGNSDGESIEEDEAVGGTDSIDEVPTMPDTSPTNDWMNACSTIQQFLYQSCDAYVNSDGTLTDEGDRAVVCIRNGAVLGGGGMIGGVPPSIAADILGGLAEMTGCGGIVDMQEVKQMVSLGSLTDLSALSRFLP